MKCDNVVTIRVESSIPFREAKWCLISWTSCNHIFILTLWILSLLKKKYLLAVYCSVFCLPVIIPVGWRKGGRRAVYNKVDRTIVISIAEQNVSILGLFLFYMEHCVSQVQQIKPNVIYMIYRSRPSSGMWQLCYGRLEEDFCCASPFREVQSDSIWRTSTTASATLCHRSLLTQPSLHSSSYHAQPNY